MSQVKKHIKVGLTLLVAAIFALNCGRGNTQTQFSKNMEAEAGQAAPTYEQWVALIGQDKTDQLFAGIGQDSLNILSYGIGVSNMVNFINNVTSTAKLIAVIGNDFIAGTGPGSKSGLGTLVTLNLIKTVDAQMQVAKSSNLVPGAGSCGGATPLACGPDSDTIVNLASVINTLTAVEVQQKLIDLFGPSGFALQRNMSGANDAVYVGRMAKVVAHVDVSTSSCAAKLCPLMQGLTAAEVTGKLAPLMMYNVGAGIAWADKLVETIEATTAIANLITVIQGVTVPNITAKMAPIIDAVTDCTKMGYTINGVTALGTLVSLINNVNVPLRMGQLINKIEDAASYTAIQGTLAPNNWHGGSQAWGSPVKAAPHGTVGAGGAISITIAGGVATTFSAITAGSGYHPDLTYSNVFTGAPYNCTTAPTLHLALVGGALSTTATNHKVANPGAGCTNGTYALTLVDSVASTGMARLVRMINYLTPANYFQMLNLIDTISTNDKLVVIIQDALVIDDLVQMLNGMTPAGVTPGGACTGVLTVTGGTFTTQATAVGFISTVPAANSYNYIAVTNGGAYTVAPTGLTDAGCGILAPASYTIVMNGAGTAVSGIYLNALPVNSMAELVENIAAANVPRLVEVINGQRIFDNTGTQTSAVGGPPAAAPTAATYLGKMVTLIGGLSQPQEGPIKVTQMINGVTNTDKIIDLIYGVTTTTNLSTIINGIFSSSLGLGCSDAAASAYGTAPLCDAGASTAGNGFIWGMRNQSVNTMVYVLENVTNTQNLIGLINGSTPAQVSGLINHVASSGNGATTFNGMRSTQVEDPNSVSCGSCVTGTLANTSTSSGAGMRLTKVIDFVATASYPYDLAFLINKTSVIKVAKLIISMDIGQTAIGAMGPIGNGTGKIGNLMTLITGTNCFNQLNGVVSATGLVGGAGYNAAPTVTITGGGAGGVAVATVSPGGAVNGIYITDPGSGYAAPGFTITPTSGGAGASATANLGSCGTTRGLVQNTGTNPLTNIGKGKMVNMVNYITGASDTAAMQALANIVNGIGISQKLGDMVNKIQRSSNMVALVNAILDPNNNGTANAGDLINLMNNLPVAEIHKLVALIQQLNPAIETATDTLAGMDQDLVAQLMAPYGVFAGPFSATVTMTSANPGVVSWAGNTLTVGRQIVFATTGALPTALNPGQVYYVAPAGFTAGVSFQIAATPGGASINTTAGAQSGTHTGLAYEPTAVSGVGYARMNELLGSLTSTAGSGFGAAPAITFGAGCGTAPTATANFAAGSVTGLSFSTAGDCTVLPTIAPAAGSATFGFVTMPVVNRTGGASGANANITVKSVYIKDGGSGYGAAPGVAFTGSTCGTAPVATATISGLSSIDVATPGATCTTNPAVTITPANGASATAIAAGQLALGSITNLYGGTGYVATNNCPISGAGGSGGVCTGVIGAGTMTGCTGMTPGNDYMVGQTVTIGGAAKGHAVVNAAGTIAVGANIVIDFAGCGYTAPPTIAVQGCTVAPTLAAATVTNGMVNSPINVTVAGTGCPRNPRVIVTGAHADGATFTVGSVTNGYIALITLSQGANNLAQTLANQEKAPLTAAVTYGNSAPNIGAREAFVRLLWHGVSYNGGNFPGVGPAHLGLNVMAGLSLATSVETVINMMNSDTTSMADLDVLIGCADQVEFGHTAIGAATSNDFEAICRANAYW